MLKELFEGHFYGTFPKSDGKLLQLDERVESGDFSLLDLKACRECHYFCSDVVAEREQLKLHSDIPVSIINIDQVFSFTQEEVGEICDFMLDNNQTVALVEMTCSTSGYVKDKRQKARRQLYNTLCLLFANPIVREHIEKYFSRYVVLSWKETFPKGLAEDVAERNMADMTIMTDFIYSPYNESRFDFDFKLREMRYPDVLIFN